MKSKKKTTRKTRATKKAIRKIKDENKMTSYSRKKRVIPGPWTNHETKLKVKAELKVNKPMVQTSILTDFLGTYLSEPNWDEKGWYPILFNLIIKDAKALIEKHGVDDVMASVEKWINAQKCSKGKPKFGTVILMNIMADGALHTDDPFISIKAKSNKKNIQQFRAIRKGKLITL